MGVVGSIGRRFTRRSRWLAERLWVIAVAEVAWTSWGHWRRLEPEERDRLVSLARKSKGRPGSHLSSSERREAADLLDKLGYVELGGSVARTVLPFRPLSSATQWTLERDRKRRRRRSETGSDSP